MSDDDAIRDLLASLPVKRFWEPVGQTVILVDEVEAAGGDLAAVEAWVEARGGRRDRTVPVRMRSVISRQPVPDVQHYFVIPDEALSPGDAAA